MENSWVELPKVIKQMGYNANKYDIANINVDELNNNELRGWQNIHYVPTIANINGNKANIYNGEMDTVSIAQFIIKEYKIPRIKKRRYYGGIKTKNKKEKEKVLVKNKKNAIVIKNVVGRLVVQGQLLLKNHCHHRQ